ncbi:Ribosome assembly protein rrb1 [Hypsizygus marmoreus]|uniref:Glutamate-rich WD repeat-containing protein 1 n=1 Tax=Hypsizygus marmoreus TaxID=39966 RepID=A0A369JZZ2_HYPMA|nr:Ribosome assembly protein rrb1 [Hypsizygus marmoreus]
MPRKRSASEVQHNARNPVKIARDGTQRAEIVEPDGRGQYEDPWEDEVESEEDEYEDNEQAINIDGQSDIAEDEDEADRKAEESNKAPFLLGIDKLAEGETLEADESSYIMLHDLNLGWSCLSLDVLLDGLGDERSRFPTSAYVVAGSQAIRPEDNTLSVLKLSSLHRTQVPEDSDDEDEEAYETLDEDPIFERQAIPHYGAINRVRAQRFASPIFPSVSEPYYAAVWSDVGKVNIYNIRPLIEKLDVPAFHLDKSTAQTPSFTVDSHLTEGYAMDWNAPAASSLSLLTGDNDAKIYLTTAGNGGFRTSPTPFLSHESSVEDIQWSPTEITVFASCSVDRSIRMWDVRSRARQSVASIVDAHESDVNVISWNRLTSYLLVSGDDDGQIKVWDLRNVRQSSAEVARFNWHKGPITSVQWHPTDDSVFAASGDDDQITLWDLSVEPDDDTMASSNIPNLPPQLLFSHHHERPKEMRWHPQIPGAIISAGIGSLSVFKTIAV